MIDISIQLPDEIFDSFRCNPQEFVKKMKLAAAIHWYQKGEISEKKAAQVAGLNHFVGFRSSTQPTFRQNQSVENRVVNLY